VDVQRTRDVAAFDFKPKHFADYRRRPASKMTKAGAISPGLQLATSG
jgi:hypothetical protein